MKKIYLAVALIAFVSSCGKEEPLFIGKWAGEPIADCNDPIVITTKTVSVEKGKTIPLALDKDGVIILDKDGPFLIPSKDGKQLVYSNPSGSGDTVNLNRCKELVTCPPEIVRG
jgi:hypothetical protein